MMPVSVCIATYNGERFIIEQLSSILCQLGTEDEVIISDDSSSDQTILLIRAMQDSRIRIYENQHFRNPIFNFEHALKHAQHDIIFLADQDDIWVQGKAEAMTEVLVKYDVAVCNHSLVDERGQVIYDSYFEKVPSGAGVLRNLVKNTYFGCCMAFRRKVLERALPFPKDIPMHDIWLGFVASLFFTSKFIEHPYTLYRMHDNNVTDVAAFKGDSHLLIKLKYRVNIIKYLPLLLFRTLRSQLVIFQGAKIPGQK